MCFLIAHKAKDGILGQSISLGGYILGVSQCLASHLSSDIVDQMLVLFRMGSWGFTMFWGGH